MKQPFVSIVIPVYNTAPFLRQCLNSVLSQSFQDIEIILVDDGSTDESVYICDEYASLYVERVKVIHQANKGQAAARNQGIKVAIGQYLMFIDSDDYIESDALAVVCTCEDFELEAIDLVFLDIAYVFSDGKVIPFDDGYNKSHIYNQTQQVVLEHISQLKRFPGSACAKLIRHQILLDYQITFQEGRVAEDIGIMMEVMLHSSRFSYCKQPFYYYRQGRIGATTSKKNAKSLDDLFYVIQKYSNNINSMPSQNSINASMAYEYLIVLALYGGLPRKERQAFKADVYRYKWLLGCEGNKKVQLVNLLFKVVGLFVSAKILNWYMHVK